MRRSVLSVCISNMPAQDGRAFFSHRFTILRCLRVCLSVCAVGPAQLSCQKSRPLSTPRSLQHISRHISPRSGASPAMDEQRGDEPSLLPAKRVRWDDSVLPHRTNTPGTATATATCSSNKAPPAPPSCSANDAIRVCCGENQYIFRVYILPLSLCRTLACDLSRFEIFTEF